MFFKIAPEISTWALLHDQIHIIISLEDIHQFDDILVLHLFHDIDLTVDIFEIVLIGEDSFLDDFDCYGWVVR